MAELANKGHERVAKLIAKGVKQGKAYVQAGYAVNKGAASLLVNRPEVRDRIEELRRDAIGAVPDQIFSGAKMADLGLDRDWVVQAFRDIHKAAVYAKDFANGNKALASIQRMIEDEQHQSDVDTPSTGRRISMDNLLDVMDRIKGLAAPTSAPAPAPAKDSAIDTATRRRVLNVADRRDRDAE